MWPPAAIWCRPVRLPITQVLSWMLSSVAPARVPAGGRPGMAAVVMAAAPVVSAITAP
jgi:hypothetical protein